MPKKKPVRKIQEPQVEALRESEERARLREVEAQLRHIQKLEAVGQLAGGVAHDFNNLMMIIMIYGDLLARGIPEGSPLAGHVAEVRKAGQRAMVLTRQLLAFSRRQHLEPKIISLNVVMKEMEEMLRRLIRENIAFRFRLAKDLGRVNVDRGQMEQVIVNLASNAQDAMPRGGVLTVETADVDLDASFAARHPGIVPGPYVRLSVADNGCGMTPEVQSRLFEPFFTTKEKGKGTGLGLPMVYGIVKQSGGGIYAASEPGKGSAFVIYLPRVSGREAGTEAGAHPRPPRKKRGPSAQ